MALTGPAGGPPGAPAGPVAGRLAALVDDLAAATGRLGQRVVADPALEFAGRAAELGFGRAGRRSANGSCHLLRAADGWVAVNLARPDDLAAVPAMLASPAAADDPLGALTAAAAAGPAGALAERAQLLGVPASVLGAARGPGVRRRPVGPAGAAGRVVLDLSALWAGPLTAHLLARTGYAVTGVEDVRRPDGARAGSPGLYGRLHAGHDLVVLDLSAPAGRRRLTDLAAGADVVIEASRPRALARLGLVADDWLRARAGRTWISITGYGRDDQADRVAFGDDAAVAGGLVAADGDGLPVFCADAVADPASGLTAALAAVRSQLAGGGDLLDVAMAGVCADLAAPGTGRCVSHPVERAGSGWTVSHPGGSGPVQV